MRVLHVVATDAFAGVERYVATVARACAERGLEVSVVGGAAQAMRSALGSQVACYAGANPLQALGSVLRAGRVDVCHVHMTHAEVVGLASRVRHRAPVLATRHFAQHRGAGRFGALVAPWVSAGLAGEIAISDFVAGRLERPPRWVLPSGVGDRESVWRERHRVVLVVQRLEPEKDTMTAVRAWQRSGLAGRGWRLRVVGEGSQRAELEALAHRERIEAVEFTGWSDDVPGHLDRAGLLLAPTAADGLGLSVLEALASGVPVVAAAAGGHLETAGAVVGAALFAPGAAGEAAVALAALAGDPGRRAMLSAAGQALQRERFSLAGHVDRLVEVYRQVGDEAGVPFVMNRAGVR